MVPRPATFPVPAVSARDLLVGSGPRLARDAFGPMLVFYVVWRLIGLYAGILAATAVAVTALLYEQRQGRRGMMAKLGLALVLLQAVVGLASGSERAYLAQPVLTNALYGLLFIGSVAIGRPLTAAFAEEMYPFPEEVRRSVTYRRAFIRISLVWGVYLLGRSALRLAILMNSSVESFLAVNFLTGMPLTALLLSWSVWYGVRFFRRSEEWGPAIRLLDELSLTSGGSGVTTETAVFNPFEPGFADDPYPHYERMREQEPVHQTPLGFWMLFRDEDVRRFLRDPGLSVEDRNAAPGLIDELRAQVLGDRPERGDRAMLKLDPPDHTRLRRLVSSVFTPRAVERLRPRIETLVDDALDRAEAADSFDLIGDLAFPLPFAVISEMLGMPEVDRDQLREWSGLIVRSLEPLVDPTLMVAIADAGDAMRELIGGIVEDKRRTPGDDLLSALIAAEDSGGEGGAGAGLSDEELLDQVMLLYIAGHETTVNLIGNGCLALLRHRGQLDRLVADPGLIRPAIDELLRFDSPVQMSRRITLGDAEVGGHVIPAGTFVALGLASANRDTRRWGPTAGELDITRPLADEHLSFGGGHHRCLGAALARLEAEVAIGSLLRRFPKLDQAGDLAWNGRLNLRGLDRLPLALA